SDHAKTGTPRFLLGRGNRRSSTPAWRKNHLLRRSHSRAGIRLSTCRQSIPNTALKLSWRLPAGLYLWSISRSGLECVLLLLLGFVQRRDGRRRHTATNSSSSACLSTGSSHCASRYLEPCFSGSFIYVRIALYRDPSCYLRSHRSLKN